MKQGSLNKYNVERNTNDIEKKTILQALKNILKLSETSKQYESKMLYTAIVFAGFFSYTLAYVFFYGYYFSGRSGELASMVQAFVNPVPFNFKSLTIIGISLIIIIFMLTNMGYKMVNSLKSKPIEFMGDLGALIVLIAIIQFCFSIAFAGTFHLKIQYLRVWAFPTFLIIFYSFINSGKQRNLFWGFIGSIDILLLLGILNLIIKTEIINSYMILIQFACWFTISLITLFYKTIRVIVCFNLFIVVFLLLSVMLQISNIYSIKTLIILFMSILSIWLLIKAYDYFITHINKKNYINWPLKVKSIDLYIVIEFIIEKYKLIILPVIFFILIAISYYSTYNLCYSMQKSMPQEAYDEIIYKADDTKNSLSIIIGNVISYKDGIYYISNDKKELITLKNNIVETRPHR